MNRQTPKIEPGSRAGKCKDKKAPSFARGIALNQVSET
jgi:hypothetical protein